MPGTIAAIRNAAKDREHEIIVVDDASTDATAEIAKASGADLVSIDRRQIAAARNAGAHHARGDLLFFVDADTQITSEVVGGALDALAKGAAGGGARVNVAGKIPTWSQISLKIFCTIYFGFNLGAGAFLFTTRKNFNAVGGFDEKLFIGEEVYFSIAVRKLGPFKIVTAPVLTSGRKLRIYSAWEILRHTTRVLFLGPRIARSREGLEIWYDGRRESPSRTGSIST